MAILDERVILRANLRPGEVEELRDSFPDPQDAPATIRTKRSQRSAKVVIHKDRDGKDHFSSEFAPNSRRIPTLKLGPRKSALGNLPSDEETYPVTIWLKDLLTDGVREIVLNSMFMRKASPPLKIRGFMPDGSNLPWVIESLRHGSLNHLRDTGASVRMVSTARPPAHRVSDRFRDWINHLKTALPDIEDIRTVERPDDKHRYLIIRYQGGLEVPRGWPPTGHSDSSP